MTDKKLTDNEIAKTIPLESQIEYCNERIKEVFDSYYRRHTDGGEEPLNICVLRDCSKLIYALNDLINRQKAEIERLKKLLEQCEDSGEYWESKYKTAKAEAIREVWGELREMCYAPYWYIWLGEIDNYFEKKVGEQNG